MPALYDFVIQFMLAFTFVGALGFSYLAYLSWNQ